MLVEADFYLGLQRLKVQRWLSLPDLKFRILCCDFLHARRF